MDVLEGRVCVVAALKARRRRFEAVYLRQGIKDDAEIVEAAAAAGVEIRRVREELLQARAHGKTHGGVVAVAEPLEPSPVPHPIDFALLIDGVDDPRNLGAVLRSAEAFGVQAVFLRRRAFDFDGGAVSRTSSGAWERLPVVLGDGVPKTLAILGCVAGAGKPIYDVDVARPLCLAIGGEKRGLSAAVRERCTELVHIPTVRGASSLPLTHAAAVAAAEVARRRGRK